MGEIVKKVQERRLKWFGHVMEMKVQGLRKRISGRSEKTCAQYCLFPTLANLIL